MNKICTSIEQSKKLAEILPLESADMYWWSSGKRYYIEAMDDGDFNEEEGHIRAWSLAALLGILPIVYTNNKKEVCGPLHIDITDSETPFVLWYVNILHKGNIVELETKEYDNLVDACVEMILKLKENNNLL